MRRFLIAVVLVTSGCAALFQDRLSKGLDGYDGRSEPNCSTSAGWAVVDGVFATLGGLGMVAAVDDQSIPSDDRTIYVMGGALDLVVHGASAIAGIGWARDCDRAYARWNADGATKRVEAPVDEDVTRMRREIDKEERLAEAKRRAPPSPPPRGFYCSSSDSTPAGSMCVREKADCARTRDVAIAGIPDLTECTLTESAWCFDAKPGDERCAPMTEGCEAQRGRVADVLPGNTCAERR